MERFEPDLLMIDSKIEQMSAGFEHSILLRQEAVSSELWAFGGNKYKQITSKAEESQLFPTRIFRGEKIDKVFCGGNHSSFLSKKGELFVFGRGADGELGLGDFSCRSEPTLLMKDEGIKKVRLGFKHSLMLKESGDLLVFGSNKYGQISLGELSRCNTPTKLMRDNQIRDVQVGQLFLIHFICIVIRDLFRQVIFTLPYG